MSGILDVLLIEDDTVDQERIKRLLVKGGVKHRLEITDSYEGAKTLLMNKQYSICLVDHFLGSDSGVDLVKYARLQGIQVPFVIVTGNSSDENDSIGMSSDADDYLPKDELTPTLLKRVISHAILRRQNLSDRLKLQGKLNKMVKLNALGEMALSITHEINNPLTVILARAMLLKKEVAKGKDIDFVKTSKGLDSILSTGQRIVEIINNTKQFFHSSTEEKVCVVDLGKVIDGAFELAGPKLSGAKVEFQFDRSVDAVVVEGNETMLMQVFVNLISNSCDAIAGRDERWIKVSSDTQENGDVTVFFQDSGERPDDNRCEAIMKAFESSKQGNGLGLGLSISEAIVNRFGGTISIDMKRENTCFTLFFPKCGKIHLTDFKVLLVDDDVDLLGFVQAELEKNGISDISLAFNGQEGIDACRLQRFDLIISDVSMPGGDGLTFHNELKKLNAEQKMPKFILVSAHEVEMLGIGPDIEFLQKPFDLRDLIEIVLRHRSEHRQTVS